MRESVHESREMTRKSQRISPAKKKPSRIGEGFQNFVGDGRLFRAVAADGFHRTAFHRFFAKRGFGVVLGLFIDVAVAAVVIAGEVGGCRLAAQIAVDALIIDEKGACDVLGIFISDFGHSQLDSLVLKRPKIGGITFFATSFLNLQTAARIPPLTLPVRARILSPTYDR
jgi:hypothetical protein